MKIRARKFNGRCAKHKRYNPAIDGLGAIRGNCTRCTLLYDIWQASLHLNQLIRRFDPGFDDVRRIQGPVPFHDPRQLSLLTDTPRPLAD